MSWSLENGRGSKIHLTEAEGAEGKTLCGKVFPADKGYPYHLGMCKTCLRKSGKSIAEIRAMDIVNEAL